MRGEELRRDCETACGAGSEICRNGDWVDCDAPESCDCQPDENGSCGTDEGECRTGTWRCVDGRRTVCNDVGPVEEQCNGLDDDCDGTTDDGNLCPLDQSCQDGTCALRPACEGKANGSVVSTGEWGACVSYADECDETGTRVRQRTVCRNEQPIEEQESDACSRDTDGQIVSSGNWGACGGFSDQCDESGTRSRTNQVCSNGGISNQNQSENCSRDTDGVAVSGWTAWSACGGFSDSCDESGTQLRSRHICQGGQEVAEVQNQNCQRDTDGQGCGAAGSSCTNGQCVAHNVTVSLACSRDTFITSDAPDTSHGGEQTVLVGSSANWLSWGLVYFSGVANIPAGATIQDAQLCFAWAQSPLPGDGIFLSVYRIQRVWADNLTWAQRGNLGNLDQIEERLLRSNTTPCFTVTSAVQEWVSGTTNNGIAIVELVQRNVSAQFYSRDYGTAASRPKLTVTYSP